MYTEDSDFDLLYGRLHGKQALTRHLRDFLLTHRPDIVHFQHTHFLGYDAIRVVRNTLPGVPIVYTLHDYLPICHREGQMVRSANDDLCTHASPRRCSECFPPISPQTFFMRERFVKSHFDLVDLFIAPSRTLREHYLTWGLPEEKIVFEPYGRVPAIPVGSPEVDRPRDRFGFFGQLSHFKGSIVLLEATRLLGPDFPGHLSIHGANLEVRSPEFQAHLRDLLAETASTATMVGPYQHAQVGALMAGVDWIVVPSIWWENSPLVIEEAFLQGRPVICSNVGGMAEKVSDGVNGLHFERADPQSLADVMLRAATTPGLWESLASQIPPVHNMKDHVAVLGAAYERLLGSVAQ
jgi:glycosyltransferase involved in cell wall biosynthesis